MAIVTFALEPVIRLRLSSVLARLPSEDLFFTDYADEHGRDKWPRGIAKVYYPGTSVRIVQTTWEHDTFTIEAFAFSSPDDLQLAAALAVAVAGESGQAIRMDGSEALSRETLQDGFDRHSAEELSDGIILGNIQAYIDRRDTVPDGGEQCITVQGVGRTCRFGSRVIEPLLGSASTLPEELLSRIRLLNYIERRSEIFVPLGMTLTGTALDGTAFTKNFLTYIPGTSVLFPLYERQNLEISVGTVHVTIDQLEQALGDKGFWVDDDNYLAPPLSEFELDEIGQHAAALPDTPPITRRLRPWAAYALGGGTSGPEGDTGGRDPHATEVPEADLRMLDDALLTLFVFVARADGVIGSEQIEPFFTILKAVSGSPSLIGQLASRLLTLPPHESLTRIQRILAGPQIPLDTFMPAGEILGRALPVEGARNTIELLMGIARFVAAWSPEPPSAEARTHKQAALNVVEPLLRVKAAAQTGPNPPPIGQGGSCVADLLKPPVSGARRTERLTAPEEAVLCSCGSAVLVLVAGADGEIDHKEAQMFLRLLGSVDDTAGHEFLVSMKRSIAGLTPDAFGILMTRLTSGDLSPWTAIVAGGEIAGRCLTDAEAESFIDAMAELGNEIAGSSGGLLGLLGKVCYQEERAVHLIRIALAVGRLLGREQRRLANARNDGGLRQGAEGRRDLSSTARAYEAVPSLESVKQLLQVRLFGPDFRSAVAGASFAEPLKGVIAGVLIVRGAGAVPRVLQDSRNFVGPDHLALWDKSFDEILQIARENTFGSAGKPGLLGRRSDEDLARDIEVEDGLTVKLFSFQTNSALHVLRLGEIRQMHGPHGTLFGVPSRDTLVAYPITADYHRGLMHLYQVIQHVYDAAKEKEPAPGLFAISRELYLFRRNKILTIPCSTHHNGDTLEFHVYAEDPEVHATLQELMAEIASAC